MFSSQLFKLSGRVHSQELHNAVVARSGISKLGSPPRFVTISTPRIHFCLECLATACWSTFGFRANIQQKWKFGLFDTFHSSFQKYFPISVESILCYNVHI